MIGFILVLVSWWLVPLISSPLPEVVFGVPFKQSNTPFGVLHTESTAAQKGGKHSLPARKARVSTVQTDCVISYNSCCIVSSVRSGHLSHVGLVSCLCAVE
jgi:hypothetical protein